MFCDRITYLPLQILFYAHFYVLFNWSDSLLHQLFQFTCCNLSLFDIISLDPIEQNPGSWFFQVWNSYVIIIYFLGVKLRNKLDTAGQLSNKLQRHSSHIFQFIELFP